ncbi:MAG: hypothetical protein Q4F97_00945 [Bacteroidales bacterium]|nr:hypothetical protein [Bacteroidales bacterium]
MRSKTIKKNFIIPLMAIATFCFFLLMGILVGKLSHRNGISLIESESSVPFLMKIVLIYVFSFICWIFQVIIHESGHLIGGLLTGYKFVSFRIFKNCIIKKDGKFHLKYLKIPGTGGQCLMAPPIDYNIKNVPFHVYNLGGVFMNFISFLVSITLLWNMSFSEPMFILISLNMVFSLFFFLLNIIPFNSTVTNDGYNSVLFKKNKTERLYFFKIIDINAQLSNGKRFRDIDESLFPVKSVNDNSSSFEIQLFILFLSYSFDKDFDLDKYCENVNNIPKNLKNLPGILKNEIDCERLFSLFLNNGDKEEISSLETKNLKRFISLTKDCMVNKKRLLYTKALFVDNNPEEAEEIYNQSIMLEKSYPSEGEYITELSFFNKLKKRYAAKAEQL